MTEQEMIEVFGERLKRLIGKNKTTQLDLSYAVDVDVTSVQNWCAGRHLPNAYFIPKICKALNVSADYLLGMEEEE